MRKYKTKIIRVDRDFYDLMKEGARMMQANTGERVYLAEYSRSIVGKMRPLLIKYASMQK